MCLEAARGAPCATAHAGEACAELNSSAPSQQATSAHKQENILLGVKDVPCHDCAAGRRFDPGCLCCSALGPGRSPGHASDQTPAAAQCSHPPLHQPQVPFSHTSAQNLSLARKSQFTVHLLSYYFQDKQGKYSKVHFHVLHLTVS